MEILREAPKPSLFIPLAEHQSTTPASFYSGPAVLHYYSDRSKVIVLQRDLNGIPALQPLMSKSRLRVSGVEENENQEQRQQNGNGHAEDDRQEDDDEDDEERLAEDIDVWVTSDKLFLYSDTAAAGVSIPYPSISLHAIQSLPEPTSDPQQQQGVYMQILVSTTTDTTENEDADSDSISVTVVPTASAPPLTATVDDPVEDKPEQTPAVAMFNALSTCSNLHPDPVDPNDMDEEMDDGVGSRLFRSGLALPAGGMEGGMPPAMPGSGGWITAENMHEFIDEDGNWIEQDDEEVDGTENESLGPGAGTVRSRESETADGTRNGGGGENDESKWRRTG